MRKDTVLKSAFNDYTIIEQIGQGGNGIVYKASDLDSELVAIKVIDKKNTDKRKIKRFKNEIYFCLKSSHPNVIKVIDYGLHFENDSEFIYYVMPLYEKNLKKAINEGIIKEHIIPVFLEIATGLEYAHKLGVIHRDIKPENILLNTEKQVVITDFGIAHFNEENIITSVETRAGERLANYKYCAPEQKEKDSTITFSADIFALGLILNEMFTGVVPNGNNFPKIGDGNKEYSFLDDLVDLMIQHDSTQRIQPIEEIKIDISARISNKKTDDELKKAIEIKIDESEVKDRLIINPPKIVGAHMNNTTLVFELNEHINSQWAQWFNNPAGGYSNIVGYEPYKFIARNNEISIPLRDEYNNELVIKLKGYLHDWIIKANATYRHAIESRHQERIRKAKEDKKREIDRIEKMKKANDELANMFK